MPGTGVKLVLLKPIKVAGVVRERGHTLLETVLPENTTREDVEAAIQKGAVAVYTTGAGDQPEAARKKKEAADAERAARDKRIAEETAAKKAELEAARKKDEAARAKKPAPPKGRSKKR